MIFTFSKTPATSDHYAPKCAAGESPNRHPLSKDIEDTGPLAGPFLCLEQLTKIHLIPISLEYASFILIEPQIQANRLSEPSCHAPCWEQDPPRKMHRQLWLWQNSLSAPSVNMFKEVKMIIHACLFHPLKGGALCNPPICS